MLSHFDDDDNAATSKLKVTFENGEGTYKASYFILDEDHDLELFREETFAADNFAIYLDMPNFTSVLVKLEKI